MRINQITGRIRKSPTIQFYATLPRDDWRRDSFAYVTWYDSNQREHRSPASNSIYVAAMKEMQWLAGSNQQRRYTHYDIVSNYGVKDVYLILEVTVKGVMLKYDFHDGVTGSVLVRSAERFGQLDIRAYFERHILPQYFYAPGFFRDLQMRFGLSKADVKARYAELCKQWIHFERSECDAEKAFNRYARRRFNLNFDDAFTLPVMRSVIQQYGRRDVLTNVERHPSHGWFDTFDGDLDELQSEFYEQYERDRPTIFI